MDLPPALQVIHQPQRLRIMGALWRARDVPYTALRDGLGLTDGNLVAHARRLEQAGFVHARRALAGDRFEVRYRLTPAGAQAFRDYLRTLRGFLAEADRAQGGGGPERNDDASGGPAGGSAASVPPGAPPP